VSTTTVDEPDVRSVLTRWFLIALSVPVALILVVLGVLTVFALCLSALEPDETAQDLSVAVEQDVPAGASITQIYDYLQPRAIYDTLEEGEIAAYFEREGNVVAGSVRPRVEKVIVTIVPVKTDWFGSLAFFIDKDDKLIQSVVCDHNGCFANGRPSTSVTR
jgi:hypothetical protein